MNEMKRMFVELVNNPGNVPHGIYHEENIHQVTPARTDVQIGASLPQVVQPVSAAAPQPILVQTSTSNKSTDDFDQHEEVDESLNIMDMEKDLIIKALKKHRNKRKDAALDLGISERTLYRKLKEYDIEDLYQQPKSGLKTYR
jgi:DNA-binding NtrC family response regulator